MFVETIKSHGLAHLSYVVGDQGQAAVIDPRRDSDIYREIAAGHDCRITHVFETHRNEDLVSGSAMLAARTGADVFHGPNAAAEVKFAKTTREGDRHRLGNLLIRVLETPGHTDDSVSYVLHDMAYGEDAVGVFTGDTLFVGDVGRADFYPDRAKEVAGDLYDSLKKLFDLGDDVIIYPAHGAGSVCGDDMAEREFSTLGYERRHNPAIGNKDREAFIRHKLAERHGQPPYFRLMERLNLEGDRRADAAGKEPPLFSMEEFLALRDSADVVDVRGVSDFLGAHPPGAWCLPVDQLSAYAGWLLDPEQDLLLLSSDRSQADSAMRQLFRMGFDRVRGVMLTTMPAWASATLPFEDIPAMGTREVKRRLREKTDGWTLLDVRKPNETEDGVIPGATPIFLGELPDCLEGIDRNQHVTVSCASGARATIGASVLLRHGFENVDVYLGSMNAWSGEDLPTDAGPH